MNVNNAPKLIGLCVVAVGVVVLLALGRVTEAAGFGLLGTIVGYIAGNGIAARRGDPVEPILGYSSPLDRRTRSRLAELSARLDELTPSERDELAQLLDRLTTGH